MNANKINQGERLKKIRKYLGLTQTDFSTRLKVTQPHYSSIEKGVHSLAYDVLMALLEQYPDIDLHWLLSGQGDMFRQPAPALMLAAEPEPSYGKVPPAELQQVLDFLEAKFPDFKARAEPDGPTRE